MRIPFLGGMGALELIIILIVVLLIFGPKNLPKLGNAVGKTVKSMRDGMDGKKKDQPVQAKAEQPAEAASPIATAENAAQEAEAPASADTEK